MRKSRKLFPKKERLIIFASGEGDTERALLRYIHNLYKIDSIHVIIDCANGSTPEIIINYAIKRCPTFASSAFVLLDAHIPWSKELENKAKKEKKLEILGSTPCCVEGFLLSLLESKFKTKHTKTIKGNCKSIFRDKYLNDGEKLDYRNYEKILPKNKIETLRKKNKLLNRIIYLMTAAKI